MITNSPVFIYYDPHKKLVLENGACEYGLGATLIQEDSSMAFTSSSLSDTEHPYAQTEEEVLAVV